MKSGSLVEPEFFERSHMNVLSNVLAEHDAVDQQITKVETDVAPLSDATDADMKKSACA